MPAADDALAARERSDDEMRAMRAFFLSRHDAHALELRRRAPVFPLTVIKIVLLSCRSVPICVCKCLLVYTE